MGLDFRKLPRSSAKCRNGSCCQQVALTNGRCYLQGRKRPGPQTKEGLDRM